LAGSVELAIVRLDLGVYLVVDCVDVDVVVVSVANKLAVGDLLVAGHLLVVDLDLVVVLVGLELVGTESWIRKEVLILVADGVALELVGVLVADGVALELVAVLEGLRLRVANSVLGRILGTPKVGFQERVRVALGISVVA